MHATLPLLVRSDFPALRRRTVGTLQINLGYRCNQSCQHSHVNAGPNRTEEMPRDTIDAVIACLAASPDVRTLDLTGGAPSSTRISVRWWWQPGRGACGSSTAAT